MEKNSILYGVVLFVKHLSFSAPLKQMSDKYMPDYEPVRLLREYPCLMHRDGTVILPEECREVEPGLFYLTSDPTDPENVLVSFPVKYFRELWKKEGLPKLKGRRDARSRLPLSNTNRIGKNNGIKIPLAQREYLGIPEGEAAFLSVLVGEKIAISKYDGPVFYFGKN
jgi:hypothetical protein